MLLQDTCNDDTVVVNLGRVLAYEFGTCICFELRKRDVIMTFMFGDIEYNLCDLE